MARSFASMRVVLFVSAALGAPVLGVAQTLPASVAGQRSFTPDFFALYAPVTALDMVSRVPGFSIDDGGGRRGFGDNAGNVLIDGDRPSTKADDIRTILSRIPANQVLRIELSEQAGTASDARGQAQVINVIRMSGNSLSGTYEANLQLGERSGISPFGKASINIRRGDTNYDVAVTHFSQYNRFEGPEATFDGARLLTGSRYLAGNGRSSESSLSATMKSRKGEVKYSLNGKLNVEWGRENRLADIFAPSGQLLGVETLAENTPKSELGYELGGDVEFPLSAALKTKIVALFNRDDQKSNGSIEIAGGGVMPSGFVTSSRNISTEAILRAQNDWDAASKHAVQFGVEVALNRLNSAFAGTSTQNGVATNFPPSDARVREWRLEPFISDVWSLSPAWKLELGLVPELSWLNVDGASSQRRKFTFIKPRAVATWTIDPATSLELRAARDVNQLDFFDFATSVDLGLGGQVDAGNAQLVPEKSTQFSAKLKHSFWDKGSVQLLASYIFVSDTQDLVPITVRDAAGAVVDRFDGPGNIGKSKRWNIEFETTLPLDRLTKPIGLSGIELKYTIHYHGSRVTDPVTGVPRSASDRPLIHHDVEFRHDISKLGVAWGGDAHWQRDSISNFVNLVDRFSTGPEVFLFIEYKKFPLGTLRFDVANPFDVRLERQRDFYSDTRASNNIIESIERRRSRDRRYMLSLSGKF
jgi:outer membrane receptor protein involved in Fe transport